MSKYMFLFSFFLLFGGCQASSDKVVDRTSLTKQIEDLKGNELTIEAGDTPTENLLYILDVPRLTKSTVLIFMDGQIETLEASGQKKTADQLRNTRPLYLKAIDESMDDYIENAATIYDDFFTQEEIDQLLVLHSHPVMQKFVSNQLDIQQKILPYAESWGSKVAARYQELINNQKPDGANKN